MLTKNYKFSYDKKYSCRFIPKPIKEEDIVSLEMKYKIKTTNFYDDFLNKKFAFFLYDNMYNEQKKDQKNPKNNVYIKNLLHYRALSSLSSLSLSNKSYKFIFDFNITKLSKPLECNRHILFPYFILDCPDLQYTEYSNLLDWNNAEYIAIALKDIIYLKLINNKNSKTHNNLISTIQPFGNENNGIIVQNYKSKKITSLRFNNSNNNNNAKSNYIAIGSDDSNVEIWDITHESSVINFNKTNKISIKNHCDLPIVNIEWKDDNTISFISPKSKTIFHWDIREKSTCYKNLNSSPVCTMKWNKNNYSPIFVSGHTDGKINCWDIRKQKQKPFFSIDKEYKSPISAIRWCPWKNNFFLCSSHSPVETLDFWDIDQRKYIQKKKINQNINHILWSKYSRHFITSSLKEITLWDYNTFTKIINLNNSTQNVNLKDNLYICMNPANTKLVGLHSDEYLSFWKIWRNKNSPIKNKKSIQIEENKSYTLQHKVIR